MMTLREFLKLPAFAALIPASVLGLFGNRKNYVTSCRYDEMVGLMVEFSETSPPINWKTCKIVEWCESPMLWKGEWVPNYRRDIYRGKLSNGEDYWFCFGRNSDVLDLSCWKELKAYRAT